jgi:oligoribonuclease NrnB/cAMP/cGMP phosphodiesterase (DHH superfamily)
MDLLVRIGAHTKEGFTRKKKPEERTLQVGGGGEQGVSGGTKQTHQLGHYTKQWQKKFAMGCLHIILLW